MPRVKRRAQKERPLEQPRNYAEARLRALSISDEQLLKEGTERGGPAWVDLTIWCAAIHERDRRHQERMCHE